MPEKRLGVTRPVTGIVPGRSLECVLIAWGHTLAFSPDRDRGRGGHDHTHTAYATGNLASQCASCSIRVLRRSSGVNDAVTALRVKPSNTAGEKPRAAAIAYSRPMVVPT